MGRKPTGRPPGRPRKPRPVGRPPLPPAEKMAPPIWLRLAPAERAEVEARAAADGVSLSAWVRGVVRVALGLE